MSHIANLFLISILPVLAEEETNSWPWWSWLLLIIFIIFLFWLLWWWFIRSPKGEDSVSKVEPIKVELVEKEVTPTTVTETAVKGEPAIEETVGPVVPAVVETVESVNLIPVTSAKPDDLTIIEGIGPKINNALQIAGITTFEQLAEVEPSQINKILKDGGFRLADPSSWQEQARLAGEEKWDELKSLQNTLKAGRRIK